MNSNHGVIPLVPPFAAVAVHRAVEHHAGHALLVGLEDGVDHRRIGHVGAALVMNDHIEIFGPIGIVINGVLVLRAPVGVKSDRPLDVCPGGDALGMMSFWCV